MTKSACFVFALVSFLFSFAAIDVSADTPLFTKNQVLKFSPRAHSDLVDALVENQEYIRDAGITTRLRLVHFFAQVATETGGMRRIEENMNYSFNRLLQVFSSRTISKEKARELAGKPRQIANWVYGNMLGNRGRQTNDGWNYRGSGFIQLTGRSNFRKRGSEVGLPLEEDPEIARQPREGLLAATVYWRARDINRSSDDNDIRRVRIKVNGPAAHGLPAAKLWFQKSWKLFRSTGAAETEGAVAEAGGVVIIANESAEMNAAAEALEELGFIQPGVVESGSLTKETFSESLRAYQRSRGLKETGVLDEDTFYEITDPQEWRREPYDVEIRAVDDPESSVGFALTPATEASAVISLEPNRGTGDPFENDQLAPAELALFAESSATYAAYEMAGGKRDENDNFIPFSVIYPDDRVAVTDTTAFPARAIVQINFTSSGQPSLCSGAMISADTVLTAGHCVHGGSRSGDWHADFIVYPGRNTGLKPFGSCSVTKLYALKGWVDAANSFEARYYDLGAMKLDCKIGTRTGWFGVRALSDGELNLPTTVQGYAADRTPAGRQWISKDRIRALHSPKGFYQNDTYGGTSGSPVYSRDDFSLIGIHTNGMHNGEPWKSNNAFTRITYERLQQIARWIAP